MWMPINMSMSPAVPREIVFEKKSLKPIAVKFFSEAVGRQIDEKISIPQFMDLFREIYRIRKDTSYRLSWGTTRQFPIKYARLVWKELLDLVNENYDEIVDTEGYCHLREEYLWEIRESVLNCVPFTPTNEQMKINLFNPWCFTHNHMPKFFKCFYL